MRKLEACSLWIGHRGDLWDLTTVFANGIQAIVDLAMMEEPIKAPREICHCRFPLMDGAGNPPWLLRAAVQLVQELAERKVPTLISCSAGMSRSPAIAAAAIAGVMSITPAEALEMISRSGPCDISPALWQDIQLLT